MHTLNALDKMGIQLVKLQAIFYGMQFASWQVW